MASAQRDRPYRSVHNWAQLRTQPLSKFGERTRLHDDASTREDEVDPGLAPLELDGWRYRLTALLYAPAINQVAHQRAGAARDQPQVEKVIPGQRASGTDRRTWREKRHQLLVIDHLGIELRGFAWLVQEAQLRHAGADQRAGRKWFLWLRNRDPHGRVLTPELAKAVREPIEGKRRRHRDIKTPPQEADNLSNGLDSRLQVPHDLPGRREQGGTGRGRDYAARNAVKKLRSEFPLQGLDGVGQRGLSQV